MGRTEIFTGPGNIQVYGEYQFSPVETNASPLLTYLYAVSSVWPHQAFWQALKKAVLWSPSRQDAPIEFRRTPAAGGLYYPGANNTGTLAFNVDLAQGDMMLQILCHEVGHHFQFFYDIGILEDDAGQTFWNFCVANGIHNVEEFASEIGRTLYRRLWGSADKPPIPGFDKLMDAIRQARTS